MKKSFTLILVLALVLLLAATLVACNPPDDNGSQNNPFEKVQYSVVFDSDGGTDFSDYNKSKVDSGSFISNPGSPTKTGYVFKYWMVDSKEFVFATTPITSNTVLKAYYEPRQYQHSFDLDAKLLRDNGSEGETTYSIQNGGYSGASFENAGTILTSTFNSDSGLACPQLAGDTFCFWYYIDNDGNPVQFSQWAKNDEKTVKLISKYTYTNPNGRMLYPMWRSNLPKLEIVFRDSKSETVFSKLNDFYFGDKLVADMAPDGNSGVGLTGYKFNEWQYKTKDADGNDIYKPLVFTSLTDEKVTPTDLLAAAGVKNNFADAKLYIYASWTKQVLVNGLSSFKEIYDTMHIQNPTEEQLKDMREYMTANIEFIGTVDLGSNEFEPLFSEDYPFSGTIDGGTYSNGDVIKRAKLKGGVFKGDKTVSVFGYIKSTLGGEGEKIKDSGTIKNLDFEDIGIRTERGDAGDLLVGIVATQNRGTVINCNVVMNRVFIGADGATVENGVLKNSLGAVKFGGIVANNEGRIESCEVTLRNVSALCESLVFGGFAAVNSGSATIIKGRADISIEKIECCDDGNGLNGVSFAHIGGFTGSNGGSILESSVSVNVNDIVSKEELIFGGATALHAGTLSKTASDVVLGSEANPVTAGGGSQRIGIGGLVGRNDGFVEDCPVNAQMYIKADKASVIAVGGIVGNNASASTNSRPGSIKKSYAAGKIVVKTGDAKNVTVYAGGIAGRNSKNDLSQNFAVLDISVENNAEGAQNKLGYLFGSFDGTVSNISGWYASENQIVLNGVTHKKLDDEDNFPVLTLGEATAKANFSTEAFVFGSSSRLQFSTDTWILADGAALPTLK